MKRYAVLNSDSIVSNLIIAKSLQSAEEVTGCVCIFITSEDVTCEIGKLYSGGAFIDPPVDEEVVAPEA